MKGKIIRGFCGAMGVGRVHFGRCLFNRVMFGRAYCLGRA